jgi:hypothetical protein
VLFEDRPLVPALPVALKARERPEQSGVQAQPVSQAGGDRFAFAVAGSVTGVLDLVPVHGPDRQIL